MNPNVVIITQVGIQMVQLTFLVNDPDEFANIKSLASKIAAGSASNHVYDVPGDEWKQGGDDRLPRLVSIKHYHGEYMLDPSTVRGVSFPTYPKDPPPSEPTHSPVTGTSA